MADLIQQGLSWLAGQLKANASQQVTYSRGASQVALQAVLGQTAFRVEDLVRSVSKLEHSDADFIFVAADLVLNNVAVVPQRGDVVTRSGSRYEVWAPAGERPWKLDPYGTMIRVHTRYAGSA